MAWPPATLPTNRTNATPQQDTHPNDHNQLAQAINDTVAQATVLSTRRGCQLQANTFSVPAGGSKVLVWDVELWDSDGFHAAGATDVIIPNGLDGTYAYTFVLNADVGAQYGAVDVNITIGGVAFTDYMPAGRSSISVAAVVPTVPTTHAQCQMWNSDGTNARNFNGRLTVVRVTL